MSRSQPLPLLTKLAVAASSETLTFFKAWRRLSCWESGHVFKKSQMIDSVKSELHPHSNKDYVFTINIMRCPNCDMIFYDEGLESRKPGI